MEPALGQSLSTISLCEVLSLSAVADQQPGEAYEYKYHSNDIIATIEDLLKRFSGIKAHDLDVLADVGCSGNNSTYQRLFRMLLSHASTTAGPPAAHMRPRVRDPWEPHPRSEAGHCWAHVRAHPRAPQEAHVRLMWAQLNLPYRAHRSPKLGRLQRAHVVALEELHMRLMWGPCVVHGRMSGRALLRALHEPHSLASWKLLQARAGNTERREQSCPNVALRALFAPHGVESGPNLAELDHCLSNTAPNLADSEPSLAEIDRFQPSVWSISGQQRWPTPGRIRPNSAEFAPDLPNIGPMSVA